MNVLAWSASDGNAAGLDPLRAPPACSQVSTDPPAAIAVDGIAFGASPVSLRRPRGQHLVELSRPGFGTVSRWVSVGCRAGRAARGAPRPSASTWSRGGAAAPDEMQSVARSRRRQVSACYEHSLKRDPTLAGTVSLTIRIGDAGQVVGTAVDTNTVPDDHVARLSAPRGRRLELPHGAQRHRRLSLRLPHPVMSA